MADRIFYCSDCGCDTTHRGTVCAFCDADEADFRPELREVRD